MNHIKLFEEFEARNVYNIERKNRFSVSKSPSYKGGWNIEYSTSKGKGRALIFDKNSDLSGISDTTNNMKDDEMYLFGIESKTQKVGIGRMLLKDIFDYFNINKIYLPSSSNHPVWNKIATKTSYETNFGSIFTMDRDQVFSK